MNEKKKKTLRVETIHQVIERYKKILAEKKLDTYQDIEKIYVSRRIQVMDFVLKSSPECYRCQDALFEKARILWEEADPKNDIKSMKQAIELWKTISVAQQNGEFLNLQALREIKPFLNQFDINSAYTRIQIQAALRKRLWDVLNKKREREKRILYPD